MKLGYLYFDLRAIGEMTNEQFFQLCKDNDDLRLEKSSTGKIIYMPPTGSEIGSTNSTINGEFYNWNCKKGLGKVFDSSTGFALPDTSVLSPDLAWVEKSRWETLSLEEKKKFAPLCPDFIVELMSESDNLAKAQAKMQDWIDNGVRLAWLIYPEKEQVFIYKPNQTIRQINSFDEILSGEDVLEGFELDLKILKS